MLEIARRFSLPIHLICSVWPKAHPTLLPEPLRIHPHDPGEYAKLPRVRAVAPARSGARVGHNPCNLLMINKLVQTVGFAARLVLKQRAPSFSALSYLNNRSLRGGPTHEVARQSAFHTCQYERPSVDARTEPSVATLARQRCVRRRGEE